MSLASGGDDDVPMIAADAAPGTAFVPAQRNCGADDACIAMHPAPPRSGVATGRSLLRRRLVHLTMLLHEFAAPYAAAHSCSVCVCSVMTFSTGVW